MTSGHDRFEALAGAAALGEATPHERELLAAHARDCASCGEDVAGMAGVRDVIERARDAESWRPSIRNAVFARIHERRTGGSRRAIGALGWAFAASVVLNAAVVSGVAGHLDHALRDRESTSDVVASHIRFDAPRSTVVPTPVPRPAVLRVARAAPLGRHARVVRVAAHVLAAPQHAPVTVIHQEPAPQATAEPSVDDPLAGLDLAARGIAAAPAPPCEVGQADAFASPAPCVSPGADERP